MLALSGASRLAAPPAAGNAAHRALLKHGDLANAAFGQSSARWRVLHRISSGETSVAVLARSTGYSRQAVQRLANALVADGRARYSADPGDRRKQRLELTETGAATFEQMEANFDVWAGRLMTSIPAAELAAVPKSLEHIRLILLVDADYMRSKVMKCQQRRLPSSAGPIRASDSR